MRSARTLGLVATAATLAACSSDLFHGTDWATRCDLDPGAEGCLELGQGGAGGSASAASGTSSASSNASSSTASGTSSEASASSGAGGGGGALCGNGQVDEGEDCDDANADPADGCDACAWTCVGSGETPGPGGTRCYLPEASGKDWEAARAACVAWGGDLVAIGSAEEQAFVAKTFPGNRWIGLNDRDAEGSFTWSSGEATTYTNWLAGQPNDDGAGEDCVELYADDGSHTWNDATCGTPKPSLCERPL